MNLVEELLFGDKIILFDGAMGTMLHSSGVSLGQSFDETNVTRPEIVASVHRAYVDAGADVIETNTFGANRVKLGSYGLSGRSAEINAAAARIAGECAGDGVLVAGSVGPTGRLLCPLGPLGFDEAFEAFREQILALCEGGVHLLIIETMQDLREMKAAILAARSVCDKPIICQMSFAQEGRTIMGTDPATAAVVLEAFRPALLGTNCGTGPQDMLDTVSAMSSVARIGVSAQPNAGLPAFHEGRLMYLSTPEYMAGFGRRFVEAGAVLIGGCCGTTPEHTKALAEALSGLKRPAVLMGHSVRLAGRSRMVELGGPVPTNVIRVDCSPESAESSIELAQSDGNAALCLEGLDESSAEGILRLIEGRAMVRVDDGFRLLGVVARHGAVALADVGDGSPEQRLERARQSLDQGIRHGLGVSDVVMRIGDCIGVNGAANQDALRSMRLIKSELRLSSAIDFGDVSHRNDASQVFLREADAVIGARFSGDASRNGEE